MGIFDWSPTAGLNANADSEINWAEDQPANTVNNSARAMMRRIRQYTDDQGGALVTTGTAPAYVVTTNSAISTLRAGIGFVVRMHATNPGASTLNADGRGIKPWRDERGNEFQSGDLLQEGIYEVYYHAGTDTYRTRLMANRSNPHGGAYLEFTSTSTITLRPRADGFLRIEGASKSVPASGVAGLAAGKQTPLATTNRVISGGVATLTLGATHSFVIGQRVLVTDIGGAADLRGAKTLTGVTGTAISYSTSTGSLASAADATGVVRGLWFVYAYDNNGDGVLDTLDISPTGHSTDAFGVEVKAGTPTRVLVGIVSIDSSGGTPVFADDIKKRLVRSFFNRTASEVFTKMTDQVVTGSGTPLELQATALRSYFVTFGDDLVVFDAHGELTPTTSTSGVGWLIDGAVDANSAARYAQGSVTPVVAHFRGKLAEGVHSINNFVYTSGAVSYGPNTEDASLGRGWNTIEGAVL